MTQTMTTDPISGPTPKGPLMRRLLVGAAFAATFVAGGLVFSGAATAAAGMAMEHCGMGHGAMAGHGGMHAMMGGHIDKMLSEVDATPDQKSRVQAILKTAMESMGPVHERMASAHGDLHRLLAAPVIDRAALEQLRAARIADIDQASQAMVKAMADAAEVLSPAQRAKLASHMAQHQP
ncbi:MAG TPA: Spy/CpxP family protein refolding chaperone [Caulobacteraceae bacterium]|jgi:Spy/CpxP family protein refolding chaperone